MMGTLNSMGGPNLHRSWFFSIFKCKHECLEFEMIELSGWNLDKRRKTGSFCYFENSIYLMTTKKIPFLVETHFLNANVIVTAPHFCKLNFVSTRIHKNIEHFTLFFCIHFVLPYHVFFIQQKLTCINRRADKGNKTRKHHLSPIFCSLYLWGT